MTFPADLPFFKRSEFQHPDLMDEPFLRWLVKVRARAGVPMIITNDARLPGEAPPGSAGEASFHRRGRAVDLRTRHYTATQEWELLAAIVALADECPGKVEIVTVYSATDKHRHLAADDRPGARHRFVEADD